MLGCVEGRDGAARGLDQDMDGIKLEFLYPGLFGMFSFQNTELLVACQKNYNDWLYDYAKQGRAAFMVLRLFPCKIPWPQKRSLPERSPKGLRVAAYRVRHPSKNPIKTLSMIRFGR